MFLVLKLSENLRVKSANAECKTKCDRIGIAESSAISAIALTNRNRRQKDRNRSRLDQEVQRLPANFKVD